MPTAIPHHIDQPVAWRRLTSCLIVRGWCYSSGGQSIRSIRLKAAQLTLPGVVGLPRPDVRAALPEAPDDNTGFEIRGILPHGSMTVVIEAESPDGTWQQLFSQYVEVERQWLPRWLGGGTVTDLITFQMPVQTAYAPRPVRPESFPVPSRRSGLKFSIVTPSFNQVAFLSTTMRSVLEQAAAVDYVVQDGGSTDGSKALISRYATEQGARSKDTPAPSSLLPTPRTARLVAWESAPDSGQADAIARGFARTTGGPDDLMAWINSDDFYLPGTLGFVVDYFARHPEVDVIYGHRILVDEDSREIGRWFLPKHDSEVLRLNDFVPQETLFWRRRIWDRVGGLDTSFQFAMDWDLLLRFQEAGAKIVRVPYFLACFRIHSAQKTSAQMHSVGQAEIDRLRTRSQGRTIPPEELENHPVLQRYLRRSAWYEFLWSVGIRGR